MDSSQQAGCPQRTDVIKIGCKDLSRENLARKDFLALMNKLTEQNKPSVLQSVKNVYRDGCVEIYVNTLWDFILRNPDSLVLYMDVQKTLAKAAQNEDVWRRLWGERWDKYVRERGWALALPQDGTNYDEFCDYVKLRKQTLAALKGWVYLQSHDWLQSVDVFQGIAPPITQECDRLLAGADGTALVDFFIEELQVLVAWRISEDVVSWIDAWKPRLNELRPSTRFKLLDLWELAHKK